LILAVEFPLAGLALAALGHSDVIRVAIIRITVVSIGIAFPSARSLVLGAAAGIAPPELLLLQSRFLLLDLGLLFLLGVLLLLDIVELAALAHAELDEFQEPVVNLFLIQSFLFL